MKKVVLRFLNQLIRIFSELRLLLFNINKIFIAIGDLMVYDNFNMKNDGKG